MDQMPAVAVEESRRRPRFLMKAPIPARFSGFEVLLNDVSETGCQIRHDDPLKIGTGAALQFMNASTRETLSFQSRVMWSRLAIKGQSGSEMAYCSGLRFGDISGTTHTALARFVSRYGEYDRQSLGKKGEALARKLEDRRKSVAIYKSRDEIPPEVMAAIMEGRDFLQLNAAVATNWYQRARYARMDLAAAQVQMPYAEDVIAVWELLGRKYPITVVALALSPAS